MNLVSRMLPWNTAVFESTAANELSEGPERAPSGQPGVEPVLSCDVKERCSRDQPAARSEVESKDDSLLRD